MGSEADQRLHPASIPLHVLKSLQRWVLPLVLVLLFSKGERWELWFMLWIVPSTAWETLRYFTVRWRLDTDELVVREGVFVKNERHVPFHRIQNLELVQGPLERLLQVVEVRIETASGNEPEAVLEVVRLSAVEEMRARVFAGRERNAGGPEPAAHSERQPEATPVPASRERSLVELGWNELVRLGLSTQRGFSVVLGVLVAANELDLLDRSLLQELSTRLSWKGALDDLLLNAGLLLAATFLIAGCLSVGWAVLRFHGYSLSRSGEELHWRAGLFTLRSATIPRSRIQLVAVHESLLQRWSGGVSVRVETAGGSGEEGVSVETRRWFVPWVARERLGALLAELDPEWGARPPSWRRPAPGFRRRMTWRAAVIGLSVGVLGLVWVEPWGALAFALWPVLLSLELREARFLAWARSPSGIAFRSGAWRRIESYVRSARLQSVQVRSSPFDRRWGMATLAVDTAGAGPAGHTIRVPYLAREDADLAARELTREAEVHGFEW